MRHLLAIAAALAGAGAFAAPATPAGPLSIAAPGNNAFVHGKVRITVSDEVDTASVLFEWSSDGRTWNPIATDTFRADGFSVTWDTAGFSGHALIRVTDSAGNQAHVRVTIDNRPPSAVLTGTATFSPNGDGWRDRAGIRFRADEAVTLTLQLVGPRGGVVQNQARDLPVARGRMMRFLWDGKIYDGLRRGADGLYTVRAFASDSAGNRAVQTLSLRLDTRAPLVSSVRASAPEAGGNIDVRFSLVDAEDRVQVRPQLRDQYGNTLVTLGARTVAPGPVALSVPFSAALLPGAYRVDISTSDQAGNKADAAGSSAPFLYTHAVRARVWGNFKGVGRRVALTFDDCYDPGGWAGVLDALAREQVKATFFCPGQAVLSNPPLALRTVAEGHAIGSHGWDHANFGHLGFDSSVTRLIDDRNVWWQLAHMVPMPFFRPPYGSYTSTTVAAAGAAGYSAVVLWEVDPFDWRNPGVAAVISRVVGATTPGAIDLMHTLPGTAAALPSIIQELRARGYSFMTLPQMAALGTPTSGHWRAY